MVRFSNESDIKSIVSLWNEAFGDSEDEIMFFIRNRYKPENTIVYEEKGRVVSMLFLLDGEMHIKGLDYPSYYLYAACTSKNFRGRGLMALLLEFAKKAAQSREYRFICLKPAEESLFGFYEKHGYKSVFSQKLLTVNKSDLPEFTDIINSGRTENLEKSRNTAYRNFDCFKWNNSAVDFSFRHNELYGGESFECCEGYMLYSTNGSAVYVKESTFTSDKMFEILSYVAYKNCAEKINVILPENFATSVGSYKIIPSGMLLPLDDEAKKITADLSGAYLGLTLD